MAETATDHRKQGQRRRSAARRQVVIDAASKLFIEQGFEAVTLDDIAAEANASKQTIYRHFGSREGLIGDVLSTVLTEMLIPVEQAMTSEGSPQDRLEATALAYQQMAFDHQGLRLVRFLIGAVPDSPNLGDRFAEQVIQRVTALLEPVVAVVLETDKAPVETEAFMGVLQGKEYNRALVGQPVDWERLEALRSFAVNTVVAGRGRPAI